MSGRSTCMSCSWAPPFLSRLGVTARYAIKMPIAFLLMIVPAVVTTRRVGCCCGRLQLSICLPCHSVWLAYRERKAIYYQWIIECSKVWLRSYLHIAVIILWICLVWNSMHFCICNQISFEGNTSKNNTRMTRTNTAPWSTPCSCLGIWIWHMHILQSYYYCYSMEQCSATWINSYNSTATIIQW